MSPTDTAFWSERLRETLSRYDEPLLRSVATRLVRPRNQWPVEELLERAVATAENPASVDRRLQELEPADRQVLACFAHSRQPLWRLGALVELAMALGQDDGFRAVLALLENGLIYPVLSPASTAPLKSFEQWLGLAGTTGLRLFAHPAIAARALGQDLGLPELRAPADALGSPQEADGLEWILRVAAAWQQISLGPLRRKQGGVFFKRDLDRLRQDPVLNSPSPECLAELPDPAFLAVALAELLGALRDANGELQAGSLPPTWEEGLNRAIEGLFTGLFHLETWDLREGFEASTDPASTPFPSAYLVVLLLLGRLPPDAWARPEDLEAWIGEHHPYWAGENARPSRARPWVATFCLGLLFPLRLIQSARDAVGNGLVRLSPHGRWLLGLAEVPTLPPPFAQTLLAQPNLEILVYRQGLTPGLVARLTQFAAWKSLGAACTLQLQPDTVYHGLEAGQTFETILQTLNQHSTRPVPGPVVDSLRTWAQKRDRITVYPAAVLLEFSSPEELNEALARGVPAIRLTERMALVPHEEGIDYKHFRLTGTRDYSLPPDKCVTVEADGVTLSVDLVRSDLLIETELPRFAVPLERMPVNGRRQYRLTPASLSAAREAGLTTAALTAWFSQRVGTPLSPAARLLLAGSQSGPITLRRHLVLHLPGEEMTDGLMQWPETRELIGERLGPTTVSIDEENADRLQELLRQIGVRS